MKKTMAGLVLMTGLFTMTQVLAADSEGAGKDDPYVSLNTWSGGMDSGQGNYMGNCLPCHGPEGKGDGPLADSLGEGIKPRNLSDAEYMSTRTDEELFNVIKHGGKSAGFSDSMPDWAATFTDEAIRNLVKFIRSDLCKCKYKGD
jgi:mono/diheme cytochrome c family protein